MPVVLDNVSIAIDQAVNITSWTETMPAGSDPVLSAAARSAACDAIVDLLDASSPTPGYMELRDSTTVLAVVTCDDPAFGAASTGVATAASLPLSTVGIAAGDADNYIVYDGGDTPIWSGSVSGS
jgi:hypothetical protein